MSQAERLRWLDSQIRAGQYPNAEVLMEQFEIGRRTAYADREALVHSFGAPLKFDNNKGGWFYTEPTFSLPALTISESEAAAIQRSLLTASEYLGSEDAKAISRVAKLLSKHLPKLRNIEHISASGAIHAASTEGNSLVDVCTRAIENRQKLHIQYFGAHRGEVSERSICPYHLHNHQGEWHLIGWCEHRSDIRQFLLSRIGEWKFDGAPGSYSIPEEFDADAYLSQGFAARHGDNQVSVTVRFTPYQSRWIRERIWHQSQLLSELDDGSVEITLTLAGTAEIKRWILSYGAEAEVQEPPTLKQEIKDEIERMRNIYLEK